MPIENATKIHELNASYPIGTSDFVSQGDDHLRLIKTSLLGSLPNVLGVINSSNTELNYLVGASSNVQAQINAGYTNQTSANAAIASANAAIAASNSAHDASNSAHSAANSLWGAANAAIAASNSAHSAANAAHATVNTTFATVNTTFATVNTTFATVNTSLATMNATVGNNATRAIYISVSEASGGANGDVWYTYV